LVSIQSNLMYVGLDGHTMIVTRDTLQEMSEDLLGSLLLNKKVDANYPHIISIKPNDNSMCA